MNRKKIILSGMRPTGKLHIGHYFGALENWVKMQDEYQNYHLVADYHVLTTDPDSKDIFKNTIDMVIDWVACGLDPVKSPIFRQSQIKEHTELYLIFSMLITKARLEKNPALKEQVRDLHLSTITLGHLGYVVLQAADILLYKGELVPVGEDQVPHIEITRHIANLFNEHYCKDRPHIFPVPDAKLTKFPRLPGLDGKAKMSKSLGNSILISDEPEEISKKIKKAFTDPNKLRKGDKGNPDICLIYKYHTIFNPEEAPEIHAGCSSGELGCSDCKLKISNKIIKFLEPMREKRKLLENDTAKVIEILKDGEERAHKVAHATISEVREAMNLG